MMRSPRNTGRRKAARTKRSQGLWGRRNKVSDARSSRAKKGMLQKRGAQRVLIERMAIAGVVALLCLFFVSQSIAPILQNKIENGSALTSIVVRGNRQVDAAEIARWTELTPGASLTTLNVSALEEKLTTHPRLAKVTAMRLFPSKILIGVRERAGVITVVTPTQEIYVVDANGVAFDHATPQEISTLPRVVSDQDIALQNTNPTLAEGITLLDEARKQNLPDIAEIYFTAAEGLSFRFRESTPKILVGRGAMHTKLAQMAKLAAVNLPETAAATLIDLRFQDRAVLKTENTPNETQTAAAP